MAYTKQTWADGTSGNTPITAERLNHIEGGIEAAHEAVEELRDSVSQSGMPDGFTLRTIGGIAILSVNANGVSISTNSAIDCGTLPVAPPERYIAALASPSSAAAIRAYVNADGVFGIAAYEEVSDAFVYGEVVFPVS